MRGFLSRLVANANVRRATLALVSALFGAIVSTVAAPPAQAPELAPAAVAADGSFTGGNIAGAR